MAAKGGKIKGKRVPAMVSPGEVYLTPKDVKDVMKNDANPMDIGSRVPGQAMVKNDSYSNDTVPETLESGGIVVPRHITTHPMARERAIAFVHKTMAKRGA